MDYVSTEQLIDRCGEAMLIALTDRAEVATGQIDADAVARAVADAQAVIDGHLAGRYVLPLVEVPPLVTDLAGAIVIWKLHRKSPDEKIAEDHREARRTLAQIAAGTVRLPVAAAEPAVAGGTGARVTDRTRPFTAETLKGFI